MNIANDYRIRNQPIQGGEIVGNSKFLNVFVLFLPISKVA